MDLTVVREKTWLVRLVMIDREGGVPRYLCSGVVSLASDINSIFGRCCVYRIDLYDHQNHLRSGNDRIGGEAQ